MTTLDDVRERWERTKDPGISTREARGRWAEDYAPILLRMARTLAWAVFALAEVSEEAGVLEPAHDVLREARELFAELDAL